MKLRHVVVFLAGFVFSLGLGIAGMTQPAKIIDFLDFTGHWDASLAMVMVGAITVHLLVYLFVRRRQAPVLASSFSLPASDRIDARLVVGAAIFGLGWGLGGYCPGPAFASLVTGGRVAVLVFGMLGGMALHELWLWAQRRAGDRAVEPAGETLRPSLELEAPQRS